MACPCVFVAVKRGYDYRLGSPPPIGAKAARTYYNVGIFDIFDIAAVAYLNLKTAVAARNDTV